MLLKYYWHVNLWLTCVDLCKWVPVPSGFMMESQQGMTELGN